MELFDYQIQVLKEDICKMFIPMDIYKIELEGKPNTNIIYNTCGYISLKTWLLSNDHNLIDLLDLIEKTTLIINKCKEVLIEYQNIHIDLETIFISVKDVNEIKIKYIEKNLIDKNTNYKSNVICELIEEISKIEEDIYSKDYLNMIINRINAENPSINRISQIMGQIKREIFISGWIGKSRAD